MKSDCVDCNAFSLTFYDGGYSYLKQCVPEVYRRHYNYDLLVKGEGQNV